MSFLRPEARETLLRWRETLAGLGASAVGLWLALDTYGPFPLIGWALVLGGVALAVTGVQKARFRRGGDGPGVVQVVEGRVTYFGPWGGGAAALDRLGWIELAPVAGGAGLWVLIEEEGARLEIPIDAKGADALFDLFETLPGIRTGHMLASMKVPVRERTLIWQRDVPRLH